MLVNENIEMKFISIRLKDEMTLSQGHPTTEALTIHKLPLRLTKVLESTYKGVRVI